MAREEPKSQASVPTILSCINSKMRQPGITNYFQTILNGINSKTRQASIRNDFQHLLSVAVAAPPSTRDSSNKLLPTTTAPQPQPPSPNSNSKEDNKPHRLTVHPTSIPANHLPSSLDRPPSTINLVNHLLSGYLPIRGAEILHRHQPQTQDKEDESSAEDGLKYLFILRDKPGKEEGDRYEFPIYYDKWNSRAEKRLRNSTAQKTPQIARRRQVRLGGRAEVHGRQSTGQGGAG